MGRVASISLRVLLTLGTIIALGLFSLAGLLNLLPGSITWAIVAFFLAGVIEGSVSFEILSQAFSKFDKDYLEIVIAKRELELLIEEEENKEEFEKSNFIKDYKQWLAHIKKLKAEESSNHEKIEAAEKKLREMEMLYVQFLHGQKPITWEGSSWEPADYAKRQALLNEITRKSFLIKLIWPLSILGGISTCFATVSAAYTSLTSSSAFLFATFGLTLTSSALTGIIIPLAIISAIGFSLFVYNSLTEIIAEDKIPAWFAKVKELFQRKEKEGDGHYAGRILLYVVLGILSVGLVIFGSATVGGTWWVDVVNSATTVLPFFINAISTIAAVTVPAYILSNLFAGIYNALESAMLFLKISFIENIKKLFTDLQKTWKEESWYQFINPFRFLVRMIEKPVKYSILGAHFVSIGLISNNLPGFNKWGETAVGAVQEGFSDLSYLVDDEDDDDHHHDLLGMLLKFILCPLFLLAAAWEFFAVKIKTDSFPNYLDIVERYFEIHPSKSVPTPELSSSWKEQELLLMVDEKKESLESSPGLFQDDDITTMKTEVLKDLRTHLEKNICAQKDKDEVLDDFLQSDSRYMKTSTGEACANSEVLGLHRNTFFSRQRVGVKCDSDEFIEKLKQHTRGMVRGRGE